MEEDLNLTEKQLQIKEDLTKIFDVLHALELDCIRRPDFSPEDAGYMYSLLYSSGIMLLKGAIEYATSTIGEKPTYVLIEQCNKALVQAVEETKQYISKQYISKQ